jgi:hypothetical protein
MVGGHVADLGMLNEERLRSQFLESVLLKAAARRPPQVEATIGERGDA